MSKQLNDGMLRIGNVERNVFEPFQHCELLSTSYVNQGNYPLFCHHCGTDFLLDVRRCVASIRQHNHERVSLINGFAKFVPHRLTWSQVPIVRVNFDILQSCELNNQMNKRTIGFGK